MISNSMRGPWGLFRSQLRKTWSSLTDDDLESICRDSSELVRVLALRDFEARDSAAGFHLMRPVPTGGSLRLISCISVDREVGGNERHLFGDRN